jgi:hypothetical protein
LQGAEGVSVQVPEKEPGEQVAGQACQQNDHWNREHPDQEVGEGQSAADSPEKSTSCPPSQPDEDQEYDSGQKQLDDRQHRRQTEEDSGHGGQQGRCGQEKGCGEQNAL